MTKFSQENFRKSHEILDQFDKQIKCYIKMFETAGLLAPQTLPTPTTPVQVGLNISFRRILYQESGMILFINLFFFINLGLTNLAREKLSFCTVSSMFFQEYFLGKRIKFSLTMAQTVFKK